MQKTLSGAMIRKMIVAGARLLEINRTAIDALNVFPVPDGDTGTNMSLTIQSAVKELNNCKSNNFSDLSDAISKGALRGARGNSGVILSQIFRGFFAVVKDAQTLDTKTFTKAMKEATKVAYGAVSKPKEGTILTVVREMSEYAQTIQSKNKDFELFLPEVIARGEESLANTPELLPVLKTAGVVDSGGKGLVTVFKGMYKAVVGEEIEGTPAEEGVPAPKKEETPMDHADLLALGEIEFGYCTEYFIIHLKKRTTLADIDKLREKLMAIGDSVICVGDLEFVKVHVHTNTPGLALTYALQLGELDRIKIENMLEENRELMKKYEMEKKEMGMLAICSGKGLSDIFRDLLVDRVIEGGQTMNPSASDIAEAVRRINAEHVFVFPNNKNIILAAEQAKGLVDNRVIHVIPTKNIPQGFSAALAFDPDASAEENKANMLHALDNVLAGQVTYAIRNTSVDGFDLKEGDVIGLDSKRILAKGEAVEDVAFDLIAKMKAPDHEIVTLYYGQDVTEDQARALSDRVSAAYPDCEVDVLYGGQPIYYYLISFE